MTASTAMESPAFTFILLTVTSRSACKTVSIFIASMTQRASPDFTAWPATTSTDLTRAGIGHRSNFEPPGRFFLWHERGKLRLATRIDARIGCYAAVRQSVAIQNGAQSNRDLAAVDRALPKRLTRCPIRDAKTRVAGLLKSHDEPFVPGIERHVMPIFAEHDRARAGKPDWPRGMHLTGNPRARVHSSHDPRPPRRLRKTRASSPSGTRGVKPLGYSLRDKTGRKFARAKAFVRHHGGEKIKIVARRPR